MRDLRFRERWLVVDLRTSTPLSVWGGVHQICDPRRPATFMHVTGTRYRWEFRLGDDENADDLTGPAALAGLLAPWFGAALPDDVEIVRHATYTFRALVAEKWRDGRVFLLGDAAHQTPPFVGQGLGAGLRDAHNLAWKLAGVLDGTWREDLLDTYEPERRPHATRTVRAAVAVGWALTGGQDRVARWRQRTLTVLCRTPGFARAVLGTVSPALGYSALMARGGGARGVGSRRVGRVHPGVLAHVGPRPRGFTIVSARVPDASAAARLDALGVRLVLEPGRRGAVLVRPDGVVAAVGSGPAAIEGLLRRVAALSTHPAMAGAAA